MFHLAYLGLMFGVQDTGDQTLAAEVRPLYGLFNKTLDDCVMKDIILLSHILSLLL